MFVNLFIIYLQVLFGKLSLKAALSRGVKFSAHKRLFSSINFNIYIVNLILCLRLMAVTITDV